MSVKAVSVYLTNILTPKLRSFGVSENYSEHLCKIVEVQMLSALSHWLDISFRKALLLIASEEGLFYEPDAKADIKCFVVLTLRNSPFESLQSNEYAKCGLSKKLDDYQIKTVTSAAIFYFNKQDFGKMSIEAQGFLPDMYGDLSKRYPTAWKALISLASSPAKCVTFQKLVSDKPFDLNNSAYIEIGRTNEYVAIEDGYSSDINETLAAQLMRVDGGAPFFVDCFKMLSRNTEKVLCVMEFLLTRGNAFVTANYYLENGYVERRTTPIKAAPCVGGKKEVLSHLSMTKGLGHKHAYALKAVAAMYGEG